MDTRQKEISQRWMDQSTLPSTPAPEIVRTFNAEFEISSGSHSFRIGRVFRCHGSDDPSLGTSTRPTPTATAYEENPGVVDFISEGAD